MRYLFPGPYPRWRWGVHRAPRDARPRCLALRQVAHRQGASARTATFEPCPRALRAKKKSVLPRPPPRRAAPRGVQATRDVGEGEIGRSPVAATAAPCHTPRLPRPPASAAALRLEVPTSVRAWLCANERPAITRRRRRARRRGARPGRARTPPRATHPPFAPRRGMPSSGLARGSRRSRARQGRRPRWR